MVKMQAVQSALAIRRQRSKREEALKAKKRKESGHSVLSTPRNSIVSIDGRVYFDEKREQKKVVGHLTMFHIGGVLILIGLMLVITSLMPSYVKSSTTKRRNDLLGTGSFFVFLGGVMTTISRFVSSNEEKELNQYIRARLTRSRSSYRLRDAEAGYPSPSPSPSKEQSDAIPNELAATSSTTVLEPGDLYHANGHLLNATGEGDFDTGVPKVMPRSPSTEPVLSRILEEDEADLDSETAEPVDSTPDSCVTPTSSLETQGLLDKFRSSRSGSKGSIRSSCKSVKVSS